MFRNVLLKDLWIMIIFFLLNYMYRFLNCLGFCVFCVIILYILCTLVSHNIYFCCNSADGFSIHLFVFTLNLVLCGSWTNLEILEKALHCRSCTFYSFKKKDFISMSSCISCENFSWLKSQWICGIWSTSGKLWNHI